MNSKTRILSLEYAINDLLACEKYILSKLPEGLSRLQVISILNKMKQLLKNS